MRGFKDALTFVFVDVATINTVENFIRNNLPGIISKWKTREDKPPINEEDFFGDIHVFDPSSFEFTEGDRFQIEAIVTYVKSIVNDPDRGVQYFAPNTFHLNKPSCKRVGQYFGRDTTFRKSKQITKAVDIKHQLYMNVVKILQKKNVNMNKILHFTETMVSVREDDDVNPVGFVECVLCKPFKGNKDPQIVQSKLVGDSSKVYWITSNFGKHIEKHLKKMKCAVSNANFNSIDDIAMNESKMEHEMEYTEEMVSVLCDNELSDEFDVKNEDEGNDTDKNDRTIILQIDPIQKSMSNEDLLSLIYNQISEQIQEMIASTLKHNVTEIDMPFEIENEKFTMHVAEIEPDGSCLFSALVHQIFKSKIGSRVFSNAVAKLRRDVVHHIKEHRLDFEYELKGIVYELNEGKKVTDIEKACTKYLEKTLPKNMTWGGSETIKAVTRMNAVNVLIMNEKGECYYPCGFNMRLKNTVILSFGVAYIENFSEQDSQNNGCDSSDEITPNTKRNHYNSVIRMDQKDIYAVSQMLANVEHKKVAQENIDLINITDSSAI